MSEYDVFVLNREIPGVPVGTIGVVLMVLGGTPRSYEVEFPDNVGGNFGDEITYTLTEDFMNRR